MSAREDAERWLRIIAEPGPIDPLAAMHDDAEAIEYAEKIIRALLVELDEKEAP
jgi:hypothetical protein